MKAAAQIEQERGEALSCAAPMARLIVAIRNVSTDQLIEAIDANGFSDIELEEISNKIGRLSHERIRRNNG